MRLAATGHVFRFTVQSEKNIYDIAEIAKYVFFFEKIENNLRLVTIEDNLTAVANHTRIDINYFVIFRKFAHQKTIE